MVPRSQPRRRGARLRPRGVLGYSMLYPLRLVAPVRLVASTVMVSAARPTSTKRLAVASMAIATWSVLVGLPLLGLLVWVNCALRLPY